jgi:2-polyprenyl-3-methyl-5-hydroxy-6-metoxy-1,4-benzoquinol methylase
MAEHESTQHVARSVAEFYDMLAPDYDAMTSFEKRFEVERPFFQDVVNRYHIHTALDAGCGSGFHSILLAQLGVDVTGVDVSSRMLQLAQQHARTYAVDVRTHQGSFGDLDTLFPLSFDAVLVMGNSLAHLLRAAEMERAIRNFASLLRPNGVLVLQVLNYDRILAVREKRLSEKRSGSTMYVRSYEYYDDLIKFTILAREQKAEGIEEKTQTITLRPVLQNEITALLRREGFDALTTYGGINQSVYDPAQSRDLVIVANRQG